jgi:DNA-binding NtrC family response regulator
VQRKPGRVELAEGGTLFLDEVGELPGALQVKLLRLLQEREYRPLGGAQPRKADVRFVAATHRDLERMVEQGAFRQDLYYRLSVLPIHLPPLREREHDITLLARHFCGQFARENNRTDLQLSAAACARLARHAWPGNVRELQNFIERLVVLCDGAAIELQDVERELGRRELPSPTPATDTANPPLSLEAKVNEAERDAVVTAIRQAGGNRTLAARILRISRRSLYNKLAEYGLS